MVMLPTSKLNSSDFRVSWVSIFLLPLQERVTPALFKNVMYQAQLLLQKLWPDIDSEATYIQTPLYF
jgi:hypothetical protein